MTATKSSIGIPSSTDYSIEERAALDSQNVLLQGNAKRMGYRANVFLGLLLMAVSDMVFVILNTIYLLTLGKTFFVYLNVAHLSTKCVEIFVFLPWVIYSADIDVVTNTKDAAFIKKIRNTPEFIGKTFFYYKPGCLYDDRDARNITTIKSMAFLSFFITVFYVIISGVLISHADNSENLLPNNNDFTPNFYQRLLPNVSMMTIWALLEFYIIVVSFDKLYRVSESPPDNFFNSAKKTQ